MGKVYTGHGAFQEVSKIIQYNNTVQGQQNGSEGNNTCQS